MLLLSGRKASGLGTKPVPVIAYVHDASLRVKTLLNLAVFVIGFILSSCPLSYLMPVRG
jgi:hypothetical protein